MLLLAYDLTLFSTKNNLKHVELLGQNSIALPNIGPIYTFRCSC